MSLAREPVNLLAIQEPLIRINESRNYAIIKGGSSQLYTQQNPQGNATTDSVNFSFSPSNNKTFIDRKIRMKLYGQIDFTGDAPVGQELLQSGRDALRAFPINNAIRNLNIVLNGNSTSLNTNEIMKAIAWYLPESELQFEFSGSACQLDMSQSYEELEDSMANPLRGYKDYVYGAIPPRGAKRLQVLSNGTGPGATASVRFEIDEPLMISPLHFNASRVPGFIGLNSDINITINWATNMASKMWSHMGSLATGGSDISTAVFSFYQDPQLLIRSVTPTQEEQLQIPDAVVYPYDKLTNYPYNANTVIAPGVTTDITVNNITFSTVPRRLWIWAEKSIQEESISRTDTFFSIEKVSITLGTLANMLAEASKRDLYNIAKKNGVNMTWEQWSGEAMPVLGSADVVTGPGSVLLLNIPEDLSLPNADANAPGIVDKTSFFMTLTVKNIHPTLSLTPRVNILADDQGVFIITEGSAIFQTGIVTSDDVRYTPFNESVSYESVQQALGGDFFKSISGFLKNLPQNIQKGLDFTEKNILPIAKAVMKILPMFGAGLIEGEGGMVGGRKMSRQQLRSLKY